MKQLVSDVDVVCDQKFCLVWVTRGADFWESRQKAYYTDDAKAAVRMYRRALTMQGLLAASKIDATS